jgi:hypothetical protein
MSDKTLVKKTKAPAKVGVAKSTPLLDIRAAAQVYAKEALSTIVSLCTLSESESVRLAAAKELLDRGYGKAAAPVELSGKDGGDLTIQLIRFGEEKKSDV